MAGGWREHKGEQRHVTVTQFPEWSLDLCGGRRPQTSHPCQFQSQLLSPTAPMGERPPGLPCPVPDRHCVWQGETSSPRGPHTSQTHYAHAGQTLPSVGLKKSFLVAVAAWHLSHLQPKPRWFHFYSCACMLSLVGDTCRRNTCPQAGPAPGRPTPQPVGLSQHHGGGGSPQRGPSGPMSLACGCRE